MIFFSNLDQKDNLVMIEEVEKRTNNLNFLWKGIKHSEKLYTLVRNNIDKNNLILPVEIRHLLIPYSINLKIDEDIDKKYYNIIDFVINDNDKDNENKSLLMNQNIKNIKNKLDIKNSVSNSDKDLLNNILIKIKEDLNEIKSYFNINDKIKIKEELIEKTDNLLSIILEYYVIKTLIETKKKNIYIHMGLYHIENIINILTNPKLNNRFEILERQGINSLKQVESNILNFSNIRNCITGKFIKS